MGFIFLLFIISMLICAVMSTCSDLKRQEKREIEIIKYCTDKKYSESKTLECINEMKKGYKEKAGE